MSYSDEVGSKDHVLVTSARQLARVLRTGQIGVPAFGKALAGKLLLSRQRTAPALIGAGGVLQLCEIMLPEPSEAARWWKSFWNDQCVDCYVTSDRLPMIVVVAKAAVWQAVPEILMDEPKRLFRAISERSLRQLVGNETSGRLMNECCSMGVSTRLIVERQKGA